MRDRRRYGPSFFLSMATIVNGDTNPPYTVDAIAFGALHRSRTRGDNSALNPGQNP